MKPKLAFLLPILLDATAVLRDHGKVVTLPCLAWVGRCCRNALISLLLLLAAAPLRAQPVITSQPTNKTVRVGETAFFTVTATGTPPLTYQWRKDGADLLGATGATLALGLARTNLAGNYTVVVTDAAGSVTSALPAMLTLGPAIGGAVFVWGHDNSGQTIVPAAAQNGIAAIAAGGVHMVALTVSSSVISWGNNDYGQATVPFAARSGVAAIAAAWHTVALKSDGSVLAWGWNQDGQAAVPDAARSGIVAIAAGHSHSVAVKSAGSVVAWGRPNEGQTTVPAAARSGVVAVAAAGGHTLALRSDGAVVAWGANDFGESNVPIEAQSGVIAIAAGGGHSVALKSDGSVVAWGWNLNGQVDVPIVARSGVTAIAAGTLQTVALKNDGSIAGWGNNDFGESWIPSTVQSTVVLAISSGLQYTAALLLPTAPVVTTQPVSAAVNAGQGVSFALTVRGFPSPSYQWRKDGVNISGATGAAYFLPFVLPSQAGSYSAVVTNSVGGVTSQVATLTVRVFAPTITTQPASQTVAAGDTVVLSVDAPAAPPPTYQWQYNGAPIPDATNAILQLDNLARTQAGNYTVVISNEAGSVTSSPAVLTVNFNVQFSVARSSVWETGRVATVTVLRAGEGPEPVTVNYATSDGTATAGQDYTATSGTLTFGPGESEKTFTIPILDDAFPEGAETLRLSLSGLTGPAVFGANTNVQLTIIDDEQSSSTGIHARPVIAAGPYHTVALKADGSLWAWGANYSGQLGIGADVNTSTNVPTRVGSDNDWATVAAGDDYSLAVKADGSLWAWGNNQLGQLGIIMDFSEGWNRFTNVPVRVDLDSDWQMVAAGSSISLGLKADGSLWQWGHFNSWLGFGPEPGPVLVPVRVGTDNDWAWVSAGGAQVVALKLDGTVWVEGKSVPGGFRNDLLTVEPSLVDLEGGYTFATAGGFRWCVKEGCGSFGDYFALKDDGTLWSWGNNESGQLGDGTTSSRGEATQVGIDRDWATIAADAFHTLAVKNDGSLWAWGANPNGQLGLGDPLNQNTNLPTRVGTDSDWVAVAAGRGPNFGFGPGGFSIGLKRDGSLWAWGYNNYGQLGLGMDCEPLCAANVPTRIGTDNDWARPVSQTVRGEFRITAQSLNVDHSRTLYFTHTNSRAYYVLYRGDALTNITTPVDAALARAYPSLTDRTSPATNATAFYRIRAVPRTQPLDLDHDGIDDVFELKHPRFLNPLNSVDAAQDFDHDGKSNLQEYLAGSNPALPSGHVLAANDHGWFALKTNGSLWFFDVSQNQLQQVGSSSNYVAVFPGGFPVAAGDEWVVGSTSYVVDAPVVPHTLALRSDGGLWAWGDNMYGQLGNGSNDSSPTPTRVGTSTDWRTVAAGGGFSTAIKSDGTLWTWGNNHVGQLGNGTNDLGTNVPVQIGIDHDWVTVDNSKLDPPFSAYTIAQKADGSLWSWGYGEASPLGLNAIVSTSVPTRIGNDSNWQSFSAGAYHVVALKTDGSLWTWGGFAPDGSVIAPTPTRVGLGSNWLAAAAGWNVSVALNFDGTLWSWAPGELPQQVGTDTD